MSLREAFRGRVISFSRREFNYPHCRSYPPVICDAPSQTNRHPAERKSASYCWVAALLWRRPQKQLHYITTDKESSGNTSREINRSSGSALTELWHWTTDIYWTVCWLWTSCFYILKLSRHKTERCVDIRCFLIIYIPLISHNLINIYSAVTNFYN